MEKFLKSCADFLHYPNNIIRHDVWEHELRAYHKRLNDQAPRIFVDEGKASLDFLDLDYERGVVEPRFRESSTSDLKNLKEHVREALKVEKSDPVCRFMFIHARHSRAPLRVSKEMLCFLFTYLQVVPSFLDFIFPFGDQEYAQDAYFAGLREYSDLQATRLEMEISQLGRSGREVRICYNLRSVEESPRQLDMPWSIRQMAVYHTFDLNTAKSVWLTVKGNMVIKDRLSGLAKTQDSSELSFLGQAFGFTLEVHLLLCHWAAENWRWYLNYLEECFQILTRDTLSTIAERPPSPNLQPMLSPSLTKRCSRSPTLVFPGVSRSATNSSWMSPPLRSATHSTMPKTKLSANANLQQGLPMNGSHHHESYPTQKSTLKHITSLLERFSPLRIWRWVVSHPSSSNEIPSAPIVTQDSRSQSALESKIDGSTFLGSELKLSDLQRIEHIEEKVQEVMLVLNLNIKTIEDLGHHYAEILEYSALPNNHVHREQPQPNLSGFQKRLNGLQNELGVQKSRTEVLLRLLAERKAFFYGILQYRSMRTSEMFANKAHQSAFKMELLTNSMHDIASKTKQETVSMRVITLVTLFFLPGTFIGTFMSTGIITFEKNNEQRFRSKGLKFYLAICIPMMFVTFLAWYLIHRSVSKVQRTKDPYVESLA